MQKHSSPVKLNPDNSNNLLFPQNFELNGIYCNELLASYRE